MSENLPNSSPEVAAASVGTRLRNLTIALAAIVLSVALVLGLRTETLSVSLTELARESIPLDAALDNGKPTLIEFYANWCTTCQAMAPELKQLEADYADRVNFVMLNVDNSKWLPEILEYKVDGIPHFVFLGADGEAIASAIGEIPRPIMDENLTALVAGLPLPYTNAMGQLSSFETPVAPAEASSTDPRSHGATRASGS